MSKDVTGYPTVATSTPFPAVKDEVNRVTLAGTRLSLGRLMAHVVWAFETEQAEHPGRPYDLNCVIRYATRAYAEDYPSISFTEAEQAIGYTVLRLFELALRRKATVLEAAFPGPSTEEADD